jgi:drug/metabolite transporter (DMT)-like permease
MKLKSNLLLLLAAAIWGLAFVAQRVGMDYVGPYTFNGVRFVLGSLSLLPLLFFYKPSSSQAETTGQSYRLDARAGFLAGTVLFIAASLQQIGLIYTTAGKAAFITCLYIVLVPILGIFIKQRIHPWTWGGSLFAVAGLYFLCVKENFSISYGDILELIGAFFWAIHILLIDHFASKVNTLRLAFFQFATCAAFSLAVALWLETITISSLLQASTPILYGGICSVGIAYTLQIVGQKNASPSHAAIILSLETVFAAIGGYLLINEHLGLQEIIGSALMLTGMLLSQLQNLKPGQSESAKPSV